MADNILTKDRSGADIDLAAKDILGVKFPRNIITDPSGAEVTPLTDDALRASPVPVSISGAIPVTIASAIEITNDAGNAIPVSAASLPLPSGAATATGVAAVVTALGSPLQAGGAVSVSNLPATQAVSAAELPLPTGAATSSAQDASNALMLEMLSEVAQVLNAILDRLPRTDANHRAVINTSDQGNVTVALAATQTLATVTTAADVTRLNTLGIGTTARPTDGIPVQMSRIGSLHLLNQIIMS